MSFGLLPAVLLLDYWLGEPKRFHPLVGFGYLADWLESKLNLGTSRLIKGMFAWCVVILPIVWLVYTLDQWLGGWWMSLVTGWLAIGWSSLRDHVQWIEQALLHNKLEIAREKLGWIVSRDTSELNETQISKAGIESLLENGSDAIFAPLFWLLVGGVPAVVLYRLSNTLDAMWGYRNERYEQFGKWAARMDDALNLIPARLTALTYALVGDFKTAYRAWKQQGSFWYSPNAGVVMAAGAGALNIRLGGTAIYHGKAKDRLELGYGDAPQAHDMTRALKLVDHSVYLWAGVTTLLFVVFS